MANMSRTHVTKNECAQSECFSCAVEKLRAQKSDFARSIQIVVRSIQITYLSAKISVCAQKSGSVCGTKGV